MGQQQYLSAAPLFLMPEMPAYALVDFPSLLSQLAKALAAQAAVLH